MRRMVFPSVDPAISRQLSLRHFRRRRYGAATASRRTSEREARHWARLLIDQYGDDAEELAEIGVIEMLAMKNPTHLVAWSMIYAAIRELREQDLDTA